MEIWYRTGSYGDKLIEQIEVVKHTEKTITVTYKDHRDVTRESRSAISSSYYNHFRTWEEARDYLIMRAGSKVEAARRSLELANAYLGNVKGLKKPA